MQVTIDGVPFVPACTLASRIGIAITTHNWADVLKRAIEQHQKHLPAGALVVVVDDGSKPPAVVPDGVQRNITRHCCFEERQPDSSDGCRVRASIFMG
ncbi:Uncharacterised protein [Enterobacter ludwigii]|nr:Uncharacterised protein [Enterobacter ludwigii]SAG97555.1 Uncharacterised protein [Enterobacter ludwigii]